MKIKIENSALETIKTLRGNLAAWLKTFTDSASDLERLTTDRTTLKEEIAKLDGQKSISESNALKLAGKRIQLEKMDAKIEELSTVDVNADESQQRQVSELLREFAKQAAAATGPGVMAYAKEIADKIRPWCNSDEAAMALAYQIPAAKSLMNNYRLPFGNSFISVGELKRAIARADEILAGELVWKWDAKIS
jgi:hypothetical protein